MKRYALSALVVVSLFFFNCSVLADTIRGINMEFVAIGNLGNAADTDGTPGCGAVGYNYRIGKYEVTNAQWSAFVNAAGVPAGNPSNAYDNSAYYTGVQQPTNGISWYEAAQFCNFLTSGDKSKGAYQFSGNNVNPGNFQVINRTAAQAAYGTIYVLPTEDEWYKAAYFKPNGSGYSLYANGTNAAPIAGVQSNYNMASRTPWNINTGIVEQNGTFDMMGNVWEWNETLLYDTHRGIRGGSCGLAGDLDDTFFLASSCRNNDMPHDEVGLIGFRVASVVPEPCSLALLFLGGLVLQSRKK